MDPWAMHAAFGSFLSTLFPKLWQFLHEDQEICNFWGVSEELKRLDRLLPKIQNVLSDVDSRMLERRSVIKWAHDLRDLVYDMEDILEEMTIERRRLEQEEEVGNQGGDNAVRNLKGFLKKSAQNVDFKRKLKPKIKKVLRSLNEVAKDAQDLGQKEVGGNAMPHRARIRPETSPLVDESNVYGRKKDKENLIDLLLAPSGSSSKKSYSVIPIVGMGGIGKTTLAQIIFQDKRVENYFDLRGWACAADVYDVAKASYVFDAAEVMRQLIECYTKKKYSKLHIVALQLCLQDLVRKKLCLIVLDDVWSWTEEEWEKLEAVFFCCANGSKILVTSRNRETANAISNMKPYELGILEDDQCWALFKEKVFRGLDTYRDEDLEKIRLKIVKKCKGLPLAAKVLGIILHCSTDERWESILSREFWHSVAEDKDKIFSSLVISYHYLPSHLKRCFEFFSLFPIGCKFSKDVLVRLWIAESFIEAEEGMLLEDIGSEYYDELQKRSLIQNDDTLHDLVQSLTCLVSRNFHSRVPSVTRTSKVMRSIRHASFLAKHMEVGDLELLLEAKSLRTLLMVGSIPPAFWDKLSNWSLLRVVEVSQASTPDLPSSIGELKHLCYLEFSCNGRLENLPDTICKLYSLQVLNISGCALLKTLPKDIGNLPSLRYLNLSSTPLSSLPSSTSKLIHLVALDLHSCKQLADIPVDIQNSLLRLLPNLPLIPITFVPDPTRNPNLPRTPIICVPDSIWKLRDLTSLNLGGCGVNHLPDEIEHLQNLRELNLEKTYILCLPHSICKLQNLQVLNLRDCRNLSKLPDDIGGLCKLRELLLRDTPISSLPESICKLQKLRVLEVLSCEQLTLLPNDMGRLRSLKKLDIRGTEILQLPDSIVEITGLQELGGCDADSKKLPPHFGKMIQLQVLKNHAVGRENGRGIGELKDMNDLRGSIVISKLENVGSKEEASTANLKSKKHIEELTLQWSPILPNKSDNSLAAKDGEVELNDILEALEPHPVALTSLSFCNYNGDKFPNWMSVSAPGSMVRFIFLKSLKMEGLHRISEVVKVELLSLEKLQIITCPMLTNVSMAPPKLKHLAVEDCRELTRLSLLQSLPDDNSDLSSRIDLPHLAERQICNCPGLEYFTSMQNTVHATGTLSSDIVSNGKLSAAVLADTENTDNQNVTVESGDKKANEKNTIHATGTLSSDILSNGELSPAMLADTENTDNQNVTVESGDKKANEKERSRLGRCLNPTSQQSRESQLMGSSEWQRRGDGEVYGGEGTDEAKLGEDAVQGDGAGDGLPADEGPDVQDGEEQGAKQPFSSQELA